MRRRTGQPEIPSFVSVLRSPVTPFDRSKTKNAKCFEECNVFGNGKCELCTIQEGRKRCKFLARKVQNSSPILRRTSLARKSAKLIIQRNWGDVTFVYLSLSLCIIGSAEALPILCVRYFRWERERERYRERETEVTSPLSRDWRWIHSFTCQKFAQLAMSLHFPLPKIRTFRFSLHTSRLSLQGEVTIVALKFAMSSHFPLPKIRPLCSLFQMARAARVIENPRQMIKSCPVLFCSSHRKTESN